jgi:hypothetical protein
MADIVSISSSLLLLLQLVVLVEAPIRTMLLIRKQNLTSVPIIVFFEQMIESHETKYLNIDWKIF